MTKAELNPEQVQARKAIIAAFKELFPVFDEEFPGVIEESVFAGNYNGWGSDDDLSDGVAAIVITENGLSPMSYYEDDWMENGFKVEAHVSENTGMHIFFECVNPAIHAVYWG